MEEMDIAAVPAIDGQRKADPSTAEEVSPPFFSGFFDKAHCQNGGCPSAGSLGQFDVGGEEAEEIL